MRIFILIILVLALSVTSFAQKEKKVTGEYTYYAPEEVTIDRAKRTALERAQLEAISATFGTNISQHNATRISNVNGHSDIKFHSFSSSDVKGEWIETIGVPEYNISHEQEILIVKCKVTGKIREITSVPIDIKSKVLRNGTEDRFESSEFRSGDDLFLSFQSPVDGYLAVYLIDEEDNAFCLLPYRNQTEGVFKIKGNESYLFFSQDKTTLKDKTIVDEYSLTCDRNEETNRIIVIFSPNLFTKSLDTDNGKFLPREIENGDFQRWLAKVRRTDCQLNVVGSIINIRR